MEKTLDKLVSALEQLKEPINTANLYLKDYYSLLSAEKDYPEQINQAPVFFQAAATAFIRGIYIELSKIFDIHKESIVSLDKILNMCFDFFGENEEAIVLINQLKSQKRGLRENVENLRQHRNRYIAHTDKKYAGKFSELVKHYPLSMKEIEDILDYVKRAYNELSVLMTSTSFKFDYKESDLGSFLEKVEKTDAFIFGESEISEMVRELYLSPELIAPQMLQCYAQIKKNKEPGGEKNET